MPPNSTHERERRRFVSDNLGLPQYPVGTEESHDLGDHVMGVVVLAWFVERCTARWGEDWCASGAIDARFRSHLDQGCPLILDRNDTEAHTTLSITDENGTTYATGSAMLGGESTIAPPAPEDPAAATGVAPTADALADLRLSPIEFTFDAARDLAFTERVDDGALWRSRGWAHPAWLGSATNAALLGTIAFEQPGPWANAGLGVHLAAPIADGSVVRLTGCVRELFDGARSRFARAEFVATVDGCAHAALQNTFVYDTIKR